ncbi:MAG TPA: glycerol-3-phosphate 1-O-acyltransferase PlsY [Magnetospirillaceae bacterium]|nr:glycerol-3-phosphate 1-O-acyltransferase PlsY [Magnetospirillaceae bacterium]
MTDLIIAAIAGYLLGSIPFGLVLTRLAGHGDIRTIGSGNIGATNVLRTGNKGLAAATLILDSGKGAFAALLASWHLSPEAATIAGLFAVLGHNFPVWLKFKGGKGVATTLGVLLAVAWPVGLAACGTWIAVAAIFRYSSLAALVALALSPFYALIWSDAWVTVTALILGVLAIIRHRANIQRLVTGTEPKIGKKKD